MSGVKRIRISVRHLVEHALQSGDICALYVGAKRALEGTRGHRIVRKSRPEGYRAEVPVLFEYESGDITLEISGRIDGVLETEESLILEEIKSTAARLDSVSPENSPSHGAQARVYAYIYCLQHGLSRITVRLTYIQLETHETREFSAHCALEDLEAHFREIVDPYISMARRLHDWRDTRDGSISGLSFPFASYREGQRRMIESVAGTIVGGGKLFVQAPAGIGKTVGVLFPALKALGGGEIDKVFYLTAKTVGRRVAEDILVDLRQTGLRCKSVTLTAKEKICFEPDAACHPDECRYARGYFDREREAREDIFDVDSYTRDVIVEFSRKHEICPFEFSLHISLWADVVIADYNYVFDPAVHLRRFFDPVAGRYTFLIDEAHNLPARARDMFSAELLHSEVRSLKRKLGDGPMNVKKSLGAMGRYILRLKKALKEEMLDHAVNDEVPDELMETILMFMEAADAQLALNRRTPWRSSLLDFYFRCNAFVRTADLFGDGFVYYVEKFGRDFRLKLFCLDPSELVSKAMTRALSTVCFSATMLPMEYYVTLLGSPIGDEEQPAVLALASPFPRRNLLLIVHGGIATTFRLREATKKTLAEAIHLTLCEERGNFLVYFPSYGYMKMVHEVYEKAYPDVRVILQKSRMKEEEREEFLALFEGGERKVAFAVMGGIFGEGIDLKGKRLTGCIVVGVGLPGICLERELIRHYYTRVNGQGFEFAYMFPGLNRVMQAAGRVIRTETDRGLVMLVDRRFAHDRYTTLFPGEWAGYQLIRGNGQIPGLIRALKLVSWGEE